MPCNQICFKKHYGYFTFSRLKSNLENYRFPQSNNRIYSVKWQKCIDWGVFGNGKWLKIAQNMYVLHRIDLTPYNNCGCPFICSNVHVWNWVCVYVTLSIAKIKKVALFKNELKKNKKVKHSLEFVCMIVHGSPFVYP